MPFNLDDYEPVEERLARFWADHPNGRVYTVLIHGRDPGESVVMLAQVYKAMDDPNPAATGHAQETPGSNPVNKTSWVENCETSAIGRALANMGYAPKGSRPSREEMAKAASPRPSPSPRKAGTRTSKKMRASQIELLKAAQNAGINDDLRHRITFMLTGGTTESVKDLDDQQADQIRAQLVLFGENKEGNMPVLEAWEAKQ